jgi:hypothetical protein
MDCEVSVRGALFGARSKPYIIRFIILSHVNKNLNKGHYSRSSHAHFSHMFFVARCFPRTLHIFFRLHISLVTSVSTVHKNLWGLTKKCVNRGLLTKKSYPHTKNRQSGRSDRNDIYTKFLLTQGFCALTRETGSKFEQHFETLSSISIEFLF